MKGEELKGSEAEGEETAVLFLLCHFLLLLLLLFLHLLLFFFFFYSSKYPSSQQPPQSNIPSNTPFFPTSFSSLTSLPFHSPLYLSSPLNSPSPPNSSRFLSIRSSSLPVYISPLSLSSQFTFHPLLLLSSLSPCSRRHSIPEPHKLETSELY